MFERVEALLGGAVLRPERESAGGKREGAGKREGEGEGEGETEEDRIGERNAWVREAVSKVGAGLKPRSSLS